MLFYLFHSVIFVILQRHLKDIDLVFIRLLPVVWVCISITGLLMNHLEEVALMFPPSMVHYVYICFGSFLLENSLPMSHNRYWYVLWTRFFFYIIARTETLGRSLSVSIISDRPPEHWHERESKNGIHELHGFYWRCTRRTRGIACVA